MNDPIEEMRTRLTERFSGNRKPLAGIRVTANDMPRAPQSNLRSMKLRYDKVGRPAKKEQELPPIKKNIWQGWL
jgi:hypothetical protein